MPIVPKSAEEEKDRVREEGKGEAFCPCAAGLLIHQMAWSQSPQSVNGHVMAREDVWQMSHRHLPGVHCTCLSGLGPEGGGGVEGGNMPNMCNPWSNLFDKMQSVKQALEFCFSVDTSGIQWVTKGQELAMGCIASYRMDRRLHMLCCLHQAVNLHFLGAHPSSTSSIDDGKTHTSQIPSWLLTC